jgi:vitamin B12 transporter
MQTPLLSTLSAALALSSPPALAATGEPLELETVVVTATRTARTADETLAPVTVIDRAAIERMQARSVPDALRGLPGVAVANTGGRGQPTTVFLRGTDSDHVMVLIDGVKVGSPTLGPAPFQDYPIDAVERIEVVRGPRASLYGSEAVGGVIQVFTRRGGGTLAPRARVGIGTYGTRDASVGLAGGGESGWLDVGARYEESSGFNACVGEPFIGGCFALEPDHDGYRNAAGHARAGYRVGGAEVDVHWLRSETDTDFDGTRFSGNESRTVQQVTGGSVSLLPVDRWKVTLAAGRSQDNLDVFYAGTFLDRFDTTRDTLTWQNDFALGDERLVTAGVDRQEDRVESTVDYAVDSRRNTGVFAQYQGALGGHRVDASLRRDDNEQFGGHTSGSAAWGHALPGGLWLTVSYGTAFKAPTFNDLYYPFFGNPHLEPETSASTEIGVAGRHGAARWSLNAFATRIDDLIAFDATVQAPANIDSARIRGLEAVAGARVGAWDLSGNVTLLDPENRASGPDRGNLLPRRPRQSLRLDVDRDLGRLRAGATLFASGRRFDDLANDVRLDGYAVVDLRAEYRLTDRLTVQGRIENLLDEDYETAAFYNQPGRGFYLTLGYQP